LKQLIEGDPVVDPDLAVKQVRDRFGRRIKDYFKSGGKCPAIRGARQTLAQLVDSGHRVGIATGGWRHTAEMKLEQAEIDVAGLVLSTCDDAVDRVGIMTNCLEKLGGGGSRVVYFGDGPWDMRATEDLQWRFIGVGQRLAGKCNDSILDFCDARWPYSPSNTVECC
jgi:phosphoglycolate phosphatase-like HAD superfamily hydrolase